MIKISFLSGWDVSEDLNPTYETIKERFQENETPIYATIMKREQLIRKGLVILTNKHLWWKIPSSKPKTAAILTLSLIASLGSVTAVERDEIHLFHNIVPGTNQYRFSLQNIVHFDYRKNKYVIYWKKFDKKGQAKVDKKGQFKTWKEVYQIVRNKHEDKIQYLERSKEFGPYLQTALDNTLKE